MFSSFLAQKTLSANQIKFVELVIDHLCRSGWLEKRSLYESPFVDLHPSGADGLFAQIEVRQMLGILTSVRQNAQGTTAQTAHQRLSPFAKHDG
jgi:type I restriction enzyme, R subunit